MYISIDLLVKQHLVNIYRSVALSHVEKSHFFQLKIVETIYFYSKHIDMRFLKINPHINAINNTRGTYL